MKMDNYSFKTRKPFPRPCDTDFGGCGKRFQPTGRNNKLCRDCITKIRRMRKAEKIMDYKKAYEILMDYFDYLPEEEKREVDKRLKELGL